MRVTAVMKGGHAVGQSFGRFTKVLLDTLENEPNDGKTTSQAYGFYRVSLASNEQKVFKGFVSQAMAVCFPHITHRYF